jgi:hypothetical protein
VPLKSRQQFVELHVITNVAGYHDLFRLLLSCANNLT